MYRTHFTLKIGQLFSENDHNVFFLFYAINITASSLPLIYTCIVYLHHISFLYKFDFMSCAS